MIQNSLTLSQSEFDDRGYFASLPAEDDEGDVEYKWRLVGASENRIEHLMTQMKFRVHEGLGQCLYELGIADNGEARGISPDEFRESVEVVRRMAQRLQFEAVLVRHCSWIGIAQQPLMCGEVRVSRRRDVYCESCVGFCGRVGAGKSTLMGSILAGSESSVRPLGDPTTVSSHMLFNHKHEVESGRTSSITTRVWRAAAAATTTTTSNAPEMHATTSTPLPDSRMPENSSAAVADAQQSSSQPTTERHLSLMDMGGGFTKSLLVGITSRSPDYLCICLSAEDEPSEATPYVELVVALGIPFFIVITKSDVMPDFELDSLVMEVAAVVDGIAHVACEPVAADHQVAAALMGMEGKPPSWRCPIFCVSSLHPSPSLELLRRFMAALRADNPNVKRGGVKDNTAGDDSFEVFLDGVFQLAEVGPVVRGVVSSGQVGVGCSAWVGPDPHGSFHQVLLRSIHVHGAHVNTAFPRDEVTLVVDHLPTDVDLLQKGKVLCGGQDGPPRVSRGCRLRLESSPSVVKSLHPRAEPVFYARNIRQVVRVEEVVQAADGGTEALCEFVFAPEVLCVGDVVCLSMCATSVLVGRIVALSLSSTRE